MPYENIKKMSLLSEVGYISRRISGLCNWLYKRQVKFHDQFQGNGKKHDFYLSWLGDSRYEMKFLCVQQHEY